MTEAEMLGIPARGQDPRVLTPIILPRPVLGPSDVLIEVRAAGVNRGDLLVRAWEGDRVPGSSDILGLEAAGIVVVAGGEWRVGDRVAGLVRSGGYAEYAAVDHAHLFPVPPDMSFEDAVAFPESLMTVYASVFEEGRLERGQVLLVHGANSGIGVIAVQMAKVAGARVVATVRGRHKAEMVRQLGADLVVDVLREPFEVAAQSVGGAHVVLDMIGGDTFSANLDAIRPGGRIVVIGMMAGPVAVLSTFKLMQSRAVIAGSMIWDRSAGEKASLVARIRERFWGAVQAGTIRAVIDSVVPFSAASAAHDRLREGSHTGKVVLQLKRSL